jgi:hypothetical protein
LVSRQTRRSTNFVFTLRCVKMTRAPFQLHGYG